jgi:hypothetical protein
MVDGMAVMGVARFERFFRAAAGVDVDKDDLKRYNDFVDQKIYDLLIMASATAKANGRDVIAWKDIPLTQGIQKSMHQFVKLDQDIELQPILDQLAAQPPLEVELGEEAQARLVPLVGGISLALARTFTILDPGVKNPSTGHWERSFHLFDLLL